MLPRRPLEAAVAAAAGKLTVPCLEPIDEADAEDAAAVHAPDGGEVLELPCVAEPDVAKVADGEPAILTVSGPKRKSVEDAATEIMQAMVAKKAAKTAAKAAPKAKADPKKEPMASVEPKKEEENTELAKAKAEPAKAKAKAKAQPAKAKADPDPSAAHTPVYLGDGHVADEKSKSQWTCRFGHGPGSTKAFRYGEKVTKAAALKQANAWLAGKKKARDQKLGKK